METKGEGKEKKIKFGFEKCFHYSIIARFYSALTSRFRDTRDYFFLLISLNWRVTLTRIAACV